MTAIAAQSLVPCVCFLLLRDDAVLLEQRRADKATDAGRIMVPGGHIEPGEPMQDALLRELQEELGIRPRNARYVCALLHPTEPELQLLHYYLITEWDGEIDAREAERVFWYPLSQLQQLSISPDDTAIAEARRLYP